MQATRALRWILGAVAAVASLGLSSSASSLESFDGASAWLNGPPLTLADLRGKVVLVDFWEYTCINCLRTLPYLRTWYDRYHNDGFTIVGVHTPEFEFSGDAGNVRSAVRRLNISWPIALDDRKAIWNRYGTDVWPRELLYDQNGNLIEDVRGEGGYPQTEQKIQTLLTLANPNLALPPVMALLPQDSYDKPGAVCYPETHEVIVEYAGIANAPDAHASTPPREVNSNGDARTTSYSGYFPSAFGSSSGYVNYVNPPDDRDGDIYLQGSWRIKDGGAVSGGSGYAALKYHAIQVVAVMRPVDSGSVRVDVTQDGNPVPKEDAGRDIRYAADGTSYVMVDAARAYDLLMNKRFGEHQLKLSSVQGGLGLYSFAFESCEVPQTK